MTDQGEVQGGESGGSNSSSLFKNFGMYAHIAEISLILGSAAYFYTKSSKLEARIAELEKKITVYESSSKIELQPNKEERQKELNDMASFLYHKIMEDISSSHSQSNSSSKKKKKDAINEIKVHTEVEEESGLNEYDDIETELKKEM